MQEQRRQSERRTLIYHLRVINTRTKKLFGYLGNLTTEGLMLLTQSPMEAASDKLLSLAMVLPVPIEGSDQIVFRARKVWTHPKEREGLYSSGYQIRHIAKNDVERIQTLIERFGSKA